MKAKHPKLCKLTGLFLVGFLWLSLPLHGQGNNPVDMAVRFAATPPGEVRINSVFGVSPQVFLDGNSSATVPQGQNVMASISLIDPDGIVLDSVTRNFNGFDTSTYGYLERGYDGWYYAGQSLLQIPWSQSSKWSPEARWRLVFEVAVVPGETNIENNILEHNFTVRLPDVQISATGVSAVDPVSGQLVAENFVPGTNYTVSGVIENVGIVITQPNVLFEVRADLGSLIQGEDGESQLGQIIDSQSILFPPNYKEVKHLSPSEKWDFEISNLYLPDDADGQYIIKLTVNPQDVDGGPVLVEEGNYTNNTALSDTLIINDPNAPSSDVSAKLIYLENSYNGELGEFRGLDPVYISFAMRNGGKSPVRASDIILANVILSKDQTKDEDDFILREFNLGGGGIGEGLLAGETLNLTWFQQMPDNFEGDYYLLIEILNQEESEVYSMDTTPIITLSSSNFGTTTLLDTTITNENYAERPSLNKSGRYIVYEKSVETNGSSLQQIYLMDMLTPEAPPRLISKAFSHSGGGNASSFRPRISLDGNTIVFHSSATDLVPGDTNNKEDVFLYRVSTGTILRATNEFNEQLNGRSLYPDVNGDGTAVVFESDATNADTSIQATGKQIYLWSINQSAGSSLSLVTKSNASTPGNGASYAPSIDDIGNRIAFDSFASNLVQNDNNGLQDVFLFERNNSGLIKLVSRTFKRKQTEGGASYGAKISGNGNRIVFVSKASNLVTGSGIAKVVVTDGGAGYQGRPTIEVNDFDFNASGAPGDGALLTFKENGINALQEINSDAIRIIDSGGGYVSPNVTIIPDPNYPPPTRTASALAYLSHPDGDIYYIDVDKLGNDERPVRVSQGEQGVGGDAASRDPSISWDGASIVYSTKSSNLLPSSVTREDGKTFLNFSYELPRAKAILVGGIGEIEIASEGIGYEPGYLTITDSSGIGTGASASYQVDNRGRIVKIDILNPGQDYHLESTDITVADPRGGSGFTAGSIRFPQVLGLGKDRAGGGRIYKVEMTEFGYGYKIGQDGNTSFADIIQFEGDGADLNEDGFPDGKIDPDKVKNVNGSLYIEQTFTLDFLSSGVDLLNTKLSFYDKNNSQEPIVFEFTEGSGNPLQININNKSLVDIRDSLVSKLVTQFEMVDQNTDSTISPFIDGNLSNSTSFDFSALSGRVFSDNPAAIRIFEHSNMLIRGSGYTKVTPVINQVPSIYGFSEIKNNSSIQQNTDTGRSALLSLPDDGSDDIYLYQEITDTSSFQTYQQNSRISTSSFGTPVGYLSNLGNTITPLSNRFPMISGNGRFVAFSSDAFGREGLAFFGSNQKPADTLAIRDIYLRDLKSNETTLEVSSLNILYPNNDLNHSFAPMNPVPILADVEFSGVIDRVEVILNQKVVGEMDEYEGFGTTKFKSNRYTDQIPDLSSGEYSLQLIAYGENNQSIATSSLIRFTISAFSGSLPPFVSLSDPESLGSITSTSIIPLSARGEDPDGVLEKVHYYVDGNLTKTINRLPGLSETDQSYSLLLDINSTLEIGKHAGFRTVFVIAEDNSGNFVASDIYTISFTKGSSSDASIEILSGLMGFEIEESGNFTPIFDLQKPSFNDFPLYEIQIANGKAFGKNLLDARAEILSDGSGTGAKLIPQIDLNPNSENYGKIIGFDIPAGQGGQGYDSSQKFTIKVTPIIRAINVGKPSLLEYNVGTPIDVFATQRTDSIFTKKNPDQSLVQGNGYVISPKLVFLPNGGGLIGFDRIPLEPTDAPISRVIPIETSYTTGLGDPTYGALLVGGFTQSPIFVSVEANSSGEKIESVSLVIDGQTYDDLTIKEPTYENIYNFSWVPDEAREYTVSAIMRDVAGNVVSTPQSNFSIKNFV